jgi:hypothetical protein
MTPETTGGYYKTGEVEAFIRKYGYPDMTGRAGRREKGTNLLFCGRKGNN